MGPYGKITIPKMTESHLEINISKRTEIPFWTNKLVAIATDLQMTFDIKINILNLLLCNILKQLKINNSFTRILITL